MCLLTYSTSIIFLKHSSISRQNIIHIVYLSEAGWDKFVCKIRGWRRRPNKNGWITQGAKIMCGGNEKGERRSMFHCDLGKPQLQWIMWMRTWFIDVGYNMPSAVEILNDFSFVTVNNMCQVKCRCLFSALLQHYLQFSLFSNFQKNLS